MKECKKCGKEKALDEFYKHPKSKDGHDSKCKECAKDAVRKNYRKNIEYYKEYDRARANLPHRVKARNDYAQTEQGKEAGNRGKRAWSERNPIKRGASHIVNNAVRDGRMVKPDNCEKCQASGRIEGHHCDYAKPLEVMWLCPKCHTDWHKENGEGLNAE